MSFNDDLNKFVHNYPYTNYHELVLDFLTSLVQDLKKIVDEADLEHLPEKFAAINSTLDANQLAISALESASTAASEAIRDLRAITSAHTQDLEAIHEEIDGVIDDLSEAVEGLTEDINALQDDYNLFKTATNTAIGDLESAAFGNLEIQPIPYTFMMDARNANAKGWYIVQDDASLSSNSIDWVTGGGYRPTNINAKYKITGDFQIPRFKSSGNPCHLVIPNVFPSLYGDGSIDETLYFYMQRWIGNTSNNGGFITVSDGNNHTLGISLRALLTPGGVQSAPPSASTAWIFGDMEIFVNQETGNYDLHLYNGRNGYHSADGFTFFVVSTIKIENSQTATNVKKFYDMKNCAYNQVAAGLNPDAKVASALSEAKGYTDTAVGELNAYLQGAIINAVNAMNARITPSELSFTPSTGVSVVRNCSFEEAFTYSAGNNTYNIRKLYIELTVDITNLEHNTDTGIGTFALGSSLTSNHNVNCDIQKPNTGCYAQIAGLDGNVAIHAYNPSGESFGLSSRVHIMGTIIQEIIS